MYKNGNLGKKAELTVEEVEMAEKALSRATTAPGTPGTPSYDPGDGEDDDEEVPDTQEGGSSSAAPRKPAPTIDRKATPKASVVDEDGDDMLLDEEPREKRGRGRPPGSKNRVGKKQKARLMELLKGANMKLVADNDVKSIALIPERQIRLSSLINVFLMNVGMECLGTNTFKHLQGSTLQEVWGHSRGSRCHRLSASPYAHLHSRSSQACRPNHGPEV